MIQINISIRNNNKILMGSTCSQNDEKCPIHNQQIVKHICMSDRCIQPLCDICLLKHDQQHKQIGVEPKIEKISEVKSKLIKSIKCQADLYSSTADLNSAAKKSYPAQYIKQLTREYFLKRRPATSLKNSLTLIELIDNLQISASLLKQVGIREKFFNFIRQNTSPNHGVLSHEYSHLF